MLLFWTNSIPEEDEEEVPMISEGDFEDDLSLIWTLTQGGGAGTIEISGGTLNFTSGSAGVLCAAEQDLSLNGPSPVSGTTYTLNYDVKTSIAGFTFFLISIGGGAEVPISGTVGDGKTMSITAGSSHSKIRIRGATNLSGRGGSIDNLSISL